MAKQLALVALPEVRTLGQDYMVVLNLWVQTSLGG